MNAPAAWAARMMADEQARTERLLRRALLASVTSMQAHAAALGRADFPGPGWWEISHVQLRHGQPARVVMRWRAPFSPGWSRAGRT